MCLNEVLKSEMILYAKANRQTNNVTRLERLDWQ
jgi:hypothetical protein